MKVLLIDHDDSFTHNLKHWLKPISNQIQLINHRHLKDQQSLKSFPAGFDLVVLSPGPKRPEDYPHILTFLKNLNPRVPAYGVCLGMQIMAIAENATTSVYAPPLHGKTSKLMCEDQNFQNLAVARYHSIKANEDIEVNFKVVARSTDDDLPMWIQHRFKKWMAVQFHPESFLTQRAELHLQALKYWINS